MRPIHRFALLIGLLAACGEGPVHPGSFTLDGTWEGRGFPYELRLELDQDRANRVRGTGEARLLREVLETVVVSTDPPVLDTVFIDTVAADTVRFDVSGEWDHPQFRLRLRAEGYADAEFEGNFTQADSIRGVLRGSGFPNPTITVVRQEPGG